MGLAVACANCTHRTKLKPTNACVATWLRQPWFTLVQYSCRKCGETFSLFLDNNVDVIDRLADSGIRVQVQGDFAPKNVIRGFQQTTGRKLLKPKKLSKKDEKKLVKFRKELAKLEGPPFAGA